MAIIDSVTQLAATVIATAHTRLQLLAVELEEESLRYFSYLMLALAAMACIGIAVLLAVLLIVALYWDTQRIPVLVGLIVFFTAASGLIAYGIRRSYQRKSRLLAYTLAEMAKDLEALKSST